MQIVDKRGEIVRVKPKKASQFSFAQIPIITQADDVAEGARLAREHRARVRRELGLEQ